MNGHQPRDQRPANCRNRLFEEGKPSPKWECESCGGIRITGCPHERRPEPPTSGSGVQPPTTISKLTLTCERLEAENAQLRDALRLISDQYVTHRGDMDEGIALAAIKQIADLARAEPVKPAPPPDTRGILDGPAQRGKVEIVRSDRDTRTGRVRVRTSWLGFAVIEEEIECIGGMLKWRRIPGYRIIAE